MRYGGARDCRNSVKLGGSKNPRLSCQDGGERRLWCLSLQVYVRMHGVYEFVPSRSYCANARDGSLFHMFAYRLKFARHSCDARTYLVHRYVCMNWSCDGILSVLNAS